ncbi:type IV pilus assembly protein PilM [Candidatus Atribacteria bacterium MT.SAG.1]|nr:type IV pilus assembly protein PilM [Candidatus Atribacteria bacterium MT.SAG.1]
MAWGIAKMFSKSCIGIDVGTFSIKIVEVSRIGQKTKIENYIRFQVPSKEDSLFKIFGDESFLLLSDRVSEIIKGLLKKAKIRGKDVFLSIPDFSTFFTSFELPSMPMSELPKAIEFEARHHIPLPLSKVTFDWELLKDQKDFGGIKKHRILLVAVSNDVIKQYQKLAILCDLNLKGLEAEIFASIRSSIELIESKNPVCLVDIGYTSTTINIVKNKLLERSYSFDISSNNLNQALVNSLKVTWQEAERMKQDFGLNPNKPSIFHALRPRIDIIFKEIENICHSFYQSSGEKVENIIFVGGAACIPGLKEYFKVFLRKEIKISSPFRNSNVSYPSLLEDRLDEIGPSFAIALGLALRGVGK